MSNHAQIRRLSPSPSNQPGVVNAFYNGCEHRPFYLADQFNTKVEYLGPRQGRNHGGGWAGKIPPPDSMSNLTRVLCPCRREKIDIRPRTTNCIPCVRSVCFHPHVCFPPCPSLLSCPFPPPATAVAGRGNTQSKLQSSRSFRTSSVGGPSPKTPPSFRAFWRARWRRTAFLPTFWAERAPTPPLPRCALRRQQKSPPCAPSSAASLAKRWVTRALHLFALWPGY